MRDSLDFLVIGTQKGGTTALFQYLRTHPEIYMPPRKEEPFFSGDYPTIPHKTWTGYMDTVFAHAPPNATWGKVTPQYMSGALLGSSSSTPYEHDRYPERLIPERIYAVMPNVRLVAMLREPVARAISAHRMETVRFGEGRTFDDTVAHLLTHEELIGARQSPGGKNAYVIWGEYGRILQAYYDVFSPEQILVIFTEEFERDPQHVVRRVFEHIRVDPSFVPPNLGKRYFAMRGRRRIPWLKPRVWEQTLARSFALRAGWKKVPQPAKSAMLKRYWDWSDRSAVWNATHRGRAREPAVCSLLTRQRLEEHYARDAHHLRDLIGRDLPWDKATDG